MNYFATRHTQTTIMSTTTFVQCSVLLVSLSLPPSPQSRSSLALACSLPHPSLSFLFLASLAASIVSSFLYPCLAHFHPLSLTHTLSLSLSHLRYDISSKSYPSIASRSFSFFSRLLPLRRKEKRVTWMRSIVEPQPLRSLCLLTPLSSRQYPVPILQGEITLSCRAVKRK